MVLPGDRREQGHLVGRDPGREKHRDADEAVPAGQKAAVRGDEDLALRVRGVVLEPR